MYTEEYVNSANLGTPMLNLSAYQGLPKSILPAYTYYMTMLLAAWKRRTGTADGEEEDKDGTE